MEGKGGDRLHNLDIQRTMPRGRPREFDTETALNNAMLVFWRRGYRATSLDDLTEAMQVNKPSLYAAFGDKESLFLQVIDFYANNLLAPRASRLMQADDMRSGLERYFADLSEVVVGKSYPPGCLIACVLTEECAESEALKEKLAFMIKGADERLAKFFNTHKEELKSDLSPKQAAKLLLSTIYGLSIRARAGTPKRELVEICEAFIKSIAKS